MPTNLIEGDWSAAKGAKESPTFANRMLGFCILQRKLLPFEDDRLDRTGAAKKSSYNGTVQCQVWWKWI
jgi:hypothetical protein